MVGPPAAGGAASSGDSPANSADGYWPTKRYDSMSSSHCSEDEGLELAGQGFFLFDRSYSDDEDIVAVVAGADESAQPFTPAATAAVYGGSGISDGVAAGAQGCSGGIDNIASLLSQIGGLPIQYVDTESPPNFTCFDFDSLTLGLGLMHEDLDYMPCPWSYA
eukprot:gene23357-30612_t